jgi:hypothetical protein
MRATQVALAGVFSRELSASFIGYSRLLTLPEAVVMQALGKADRIFAILFFTTALVLRILFAYHFRIDSDEPQHLHVVWAWTHGLLPYRDVFDNHAPLFQALCAPLFHLLGVRPDVVFPMRLAMIPLFGLTIWCVWKITASIFPLRIALWTAVLVTFVPQFFLTSIEFRPDQLWTMVWLLALTVVVTGRATVARAFSVGLLLGLAFSVSMKTILLAVSLVLACIGIMLILHRAGRPIGPGALLKYLGAATLGVTVVPMLVMLFFVTHGAGRQMLYCVIGHNILPGFTSAARILRSAVRWLVGWPVVFLGAWIIWRLRETLAIRLRLTLIFLTGILYYTTLVCFWPIREAETYLPFFPVIAITVAPCILWLAAFVSTRARVPAVIVPTLIVAVEILFILKNESPFVDKTADKIGMIADILKLTDESEYVMDSKGETIYRRRPFYYVLDGITKRKIHRKLIHDDILQRLIETRAPLATTRRMTRADAVFINANYLPIAFRLSALGKIVRLGHEPETEPTTFEVVIPSRYTLVCVSGKIAGILDGTLFQGARQLSAGRHVFRETAGAGPVALIWAQAIERGYSPFAAIKADYSTKQD